MSLFKEEFYTDDYDQDMLDFIKGKYPVDKHMTFSTERFLYYSVIDNDFSTLSNAPRSTYLAKQQFKEKIGMTKKDENTLTKDMLKTGMIVEHKYPVTGETSLCMVLLDTKNGDILAGETWCLLDDGISHIISVYQPSTNMHFLNTAEGFDAGLNLEGCELIWERKSPEQLEIDKLQAEVDERLKRITELKENM